MTALLLNLAIESFAAKSAAILAAFGEFFTRSFGHNSKSRGLVDKQILYTHALFRRECFNSYWKMAQEHAAAGGTYNIYMAESNMAENVGAKIQ